MSAQQKKSVEMLFLAVAWISVMACLIRTDYNFAFAFLSYYLWISKDDATNSLIILVLNSLSTIVDFIWILSVGYIWTHEYKNNKVWNSLHGLHVYVIFCSVLNMILKIAAMVFVGLVRKSQKDKDQYKDNNNAHQDNNNYMQQQQYQQN